MGEVIRLQFRTFRIAYTDGEGEDYVSDGYGSDWETRDRDEAQEYMINLAFQWPGFLFWVVIGR